MCYEKYNRRLQAKARERYQDLPEEEKTSNDNMVAKDTKIFINVRN